MAYTIHNLNYQPGSFIGDLIDSGQTREQVLRALKAHGLTPYDKSLVRSLPRFGKALIIAGPGLQRSFCIVHR